MRKGRGCDIENRICGVMEQYLSGALINRETYKYQNTGSELLDSEGHPGWRDGRTRFGMEGDVGGGFSLQRRTFRSFPASCHIEYRYGMGDSGWIYDGEIHANVLGKSYGKTSLPPEISKIELNFIGTKGIRNNPVKPQGDMGQFLGEIHELPKLVDVSKLKSKVDFFRRLGKEYLNVQFGWKPFLKSLQSHFKAIEQRDAVLRQLARDNGRTVRRGMQLPVNRTTNAVTTTGYFTSPSLPSYLYDGIQTQHKTDTTEEKRWFAGKFRYWIPTMIRQESFWSLEANTQRNRLTRVVHGISMTPDLVWQLTPWSWLADWKLNVGDIISNWTDINLNNLDIVYAYAMCSRTERTEYVVSAPFKGKKIMCSALDLKESKGRAPSSPFGFGVDTSQITAYQGSILAALGLSRLS